MNLRKHVLWLAPLAGLATAVGTLIADSSAVFFAIVLGLVVVAVVGFVLSKPSKKNIGGEIREARRGGMTACSWWS